MPRRKKSDKPVPPATPTKPEAPQVAHGDPKPPVRSRHYLYNSTGWVLCYDVEGPHVILHRSLRGAKMNDVYLSREEARRHYRTQRDVLGFKVLEPATPLPADADVPVTGTPEGL